MTTTYRNPWHHPRQPMYGPANYETDVKPVEYRGFLIFQRIEGHVWDVVKDGVCQSQLAGPNGARRYIDARLATETPDNRCTLVDAAGRPRWSRIFPAKQ